MIDIQSMNKQQLVELIKKNFESPDKSLFTQADNIRKKYYDDKVYLRGLIEFSNFCNKGCYYCGISSSCKDIARYRLNYEQILEASKIGYDLGFRTFVLQGGEDPYFDDALFCKIISTIKNTYSDVAITLSLGERSKKSYKNLFNAGADRYLLRHETANNEHYRHLHPDDHSLNTRKQCLYDLKEIGYQVGAGFMVDSPFQTYETLADDLLFLKDLQPHMVGIGPFIPSQNTIFKDEPKGTLSHTLVMMSLTRLMLPKVLLPATTALGTISPNGRELGLKSGGNVVMPNLSPTSVRAKYSLYDNKICTGDEASECILCISNRIKKSGYTPDFQRGDHIEMSGLNV